VASRHADLHQHAANIPNKPLKNMAHCVEHTWGLKEFHVADQVADLVMTLCLDNITDCGKIQ
jgi:hypothetical protein